MTEGRARVKLAPMGLERTFPSPAATPIEVHEPPRRAVPLVLASPHSGSAYTADFLEASRLDLPTLRRSEDSFVDEIFAEAPRLGAPLLRALFPRAYIDPNREPFELDPAMFEDALPAYANTSSSRVAAGLGTIARVVSSGQEIYAAKLRFADAAQRINAHYRPYHRALRGLLDATRRSFGCYLLIDCHSMPSVGGPPDPDAGRKRPDFVLGDCFGASCADAVIGLVETTLRERGYSVTRNRPFAGGFTTRHYGRPGQAPPDPEMIPLTVLEVRRLRLWPPGEIEHWSGWMRTHQARSRWFHRRTRLERDQEITMNALVM